MSDMVSGWLDGRGERVLLEHVFAVVGEDLHKGKGVPRLEGIPLQPARPR